MSDQYKLEVINPAGWRKVYILQKGIIHLGSAASNDIVLEGGLGVSGLHAQLITAGQTGYKLVNLSPADIPLGSAGDNLLAPRSVLHLVAGTIFRLGDFTLVFGDGIPTSLRESAPSPAGEASAEIAPAPGARGGNIGLRLALPYPHLAPNQTLEGAVIISNRGERSGVKFDLTLEGLAEEFFELAPGPVLSSGAEKNVVIRLYHLGIKPLAGDYPITLRASAPQGYPGEQATVTETLRVLPFYQHQLRILPGDGLTLSPKPEATAPVEVPTPNGVERSPQPKGLLAQTWATSIPEKAAPADEATLRLKAKSREPALPEPPASAKPEPPSLEETLWTAPLAPPPPPSPTTAANAKAEALWAAAKPVEVASTPHTDKVSAVVGNSKSRPDQGPAATEAAEETSTAPGPDTAESSAPPANGNGHQPIQPAAEPDWWSKAVTPTPADRAKVIKHKVGSTPLEKEYRPASEAEALWSGSSHEA